MVTMEKLLENLTSSAMKQRMTAVDELQVRPEERTTHTRQRGGVAKLPSFFIFLFFFPLRHPTQRPLEKGCAGWGKEMETRLPPHVLFLPPSLSLQCARSWKGETHAARALPPRRCSHDGVKNPPLYSPPLPHTHRARAAEVERGTRSFFFFFPFKRESAFFLFFFF